MAAFSSERVGLGLRDPLSFFIPPVLSFLDLLNRTAAGVGIETISLDADTLIEEASRQTGLEEFGSDFQREHLARLIAGLQQEARLNLAGYLLARADISMLLANRLRIVEHARRDPAIPAQSICAPVFVTGLPRTGTTLLHRLLAQDPDHRAPLTWEILHPSPPPACGEKSVAARIARTERQLCWFRRLANGLDCMHDLGAREPEECIAIIAHTFTGARFHATYWVPGYEAWLRRVDMRPGYRFHRRFLQHLQVHQAPRRWILKAPAHIESLDALFDIYPDALVVQTHREPMMALASSASLTHTLQSPFRQPIPPAIVGEQVVKRWALAARKCVADRKRLAKQSARFLDIRYADLIRDPIGTVRKVYEHLGSRFRPETERRIQAYLTRNSPGKNGPHLYHAEKFGIAHQRVVEAFAGYYEYFGFDFFGPPSRPARGDHFGRPLTPRGRPSLFQCDPASRSRDPGNDG